MITPLRELPLSHDFMFGEVMRQEKVCKLFLEALLHRDIQRIEYIDRQKDFSDEYLGHGIRLDVYLQDELGTVYNIEMQNSPRDDLPRRARYYQSGMDRRLLEKAAYYSDLRESFIIFVCSYDPFRKGLAVYERVSVAKDDPGVCFDDGAHLFILNSDYQTGNGDERILEFLRYLKTNDDAVPCSSQLMAEVRTAVHYVRSDSAKEEKYMTLEMKLADVKHESLRQGREEGIQQGLQQGREKALAESVAALMREMSFPFGKACDVLRIPESDREGIQRLLQ